MRRRISVVWLLLLICFLFADNLWARQKVALYPIESSDAKLGQEATNYITNTVGGKYPILLPDKFEPVLQAEQASRPDYPMESFYPVLLTELDVRYLISGRAEPEPNHGVKYEISAFDLLTNRSRVFIQECVVQEKRDILHKMGREIVRYLLDRDSLRLTSERDSDMVTSILPFLQKCPRPPVALAISEKIGGQISLMLLAESTLHYYLESAKFTINDGETGLLRAYSKFYFANEFREFPRALTAWYYIIGEASAEPGKNEAGLIGAKSKLDVRLLNREGKEILRSKVETEASALSFDSAVVKALNVSASEIALKLLPLLKY
ncbi:MAG: hypothetical protein V2A65_04555 [Candidatus Omnitrophota bacterium]